MIPQPLRTHQIDRSLEPLIDIQGLVMRFGARTVIDGISLQVHRKETVVILGRSGTGKSVTLKTIIGLLNPSAGSVRVLGRQVAHLPEAERLQFRRQIGYVFQDAALFDSLTVLENVGFPLYQRGVAEETIRDVVKRRLEMVGLGHTLQQRPSELSGGMRKRVGLARAIVELPPIVLYDEPTSGLDPLTTDVINQIILRLRAQAGTTSVVVTHDMSSAFTIADRIIMLDQGRVVIDGTPAEIRASPNPWVQHFLAGQALESERIDTARFSLPTGMVLQPPTIRLRDTLSVPSVQPHAIPPSIRLRRSSEDTPPIKRGPHSSSRLRRSTTQAPPESPAEEDSGLHEPLDLLPDQDGSSGLSRLRPIVTSEPSDTADMANNPTIELEDDQDRLSPL